MLSTKYTKEEAVCEESVVEGETIDTQLEVVDAQRERKRHCRCEHYRGLEQMVRGGDL